MKLYYFKSEYGNFGDDLNLWLWPKLLPSNFFDDDASQLLVGIGTLLNHRIPAAQRTIVFGSGHGYGTKPAIKSSWDILCVRGPKTATELALDPKCAITDPAILIYKFTRNAIHPVAGRVGLLMHCDSATYGEWDELAKEAGLHFIDARWSVDQVILEIGSCEHIVTEAMHGAIFADSMRVPWTPIVAYPHISRFKWQDWCASMELEYDPKEVPPNWKGDIELTVDHILKNKIKRSLGKFGLASKGWTMPLPNRSTTGERTKTIMKLIQIATQIAPKLSDERIHSLRIEQLYERLNILQRKYCN